MKISYPVASILGSIAESEAVAIDVPMAIAVADERGGLIRFSRMDGALPASSDIAVAKAYTAAALRMPTQDLGILAQPGRPLYGIEKTMPGKIAVFGGGLPLRLGQRVVGAIGVSGGTVEQDVRVARAASDSLQKMVIWQKALLPLMPPKPEGKAWVLGLKDRLAWALGDPKFHSDPDLNRILSGAVLLSYSDD